MNLKWIKLRIVALSWMGTQLWVICEELLARINFPSTSFVKEVRSFGYSVSGFVIHLHRIIYVRFVVTQHHSKYNWFTFVSISSILFVSDQVRHIFKTILGNLLWVILLRTDVFTYLNFVIILLSLVFVYP